MRSQHFSQHTNSQSVCQCPYVKSLALTLLLWLHSVCSSGSLIRQGTTPSQPATGTLCHHHWLLLLCYLCIDGESFMSINSLEISPVPRFKLMCSLAPRPGALQPDPADADQICSMTVSPLSAPTTERCSCHAAYTGSSTFLSVLAASESALRLLFASSAHQSILHQGQSMCKPESLLSSSPAPDQIAEEIILF